MGAKTYTPGTSNQTIASGQYLSGTQTIKGDADLIASNIKSGANIFGVTGTYSGEYKAKSFGKTVARYPDTFIFNGSWKTMGYEKYSNCDSNGYCDIDQQHPTFKVDLGISVSQVILAVVTLHADTTSAYPFRVSNGYASGTSTAQFRYIDYLLAARLPSSSDYYASSIYSSTSATANRFRNFVDVSNSGTVTFTVDTTRNANTNGTSNSIYQTSGTKFYLSGYIIYK